MPGHRDKLAIEFRSAATDTTPGIEQRQDDALQTCFTAKQAAGIRLKHPASALGNNQSKRLHKPTDLVGEFGRNLD